MTFDEVTRKAAQQAESAVAATVKGLQNKNVQDEDDMNAFLVGALRAKFDGSSIGGVKLSATIFRHRRGKAAEESQYGADILIHVSMNTTTQAFSKGVLVQAKKSEATDYWSPKARGDLVRQCNRMLTVTPSAFVFNYSKRGVRCGAATRVAGVRGAQSVNYLCGWTSYRFFLELFRCPIGDPRITSDRVDELRVPFGLKISLSGEVSLAEKASLS